MEVSSAGWRKPVDEPYPSPGLVARLYEAGVRFTTASDAHEPALIGDRFADLAALLRAAGVDRGHRCSKAAPRVASARCDLTTGSITRS